MMRSEFLQSSWPSFNKDEFGDFGLVMDAVDHYNFSPPFITTEDSSDNSIISGFPTIFFPDHELADLPVLVDELDITFPADDFSIAMEGFGIECMFEFPSQQLGEDHEWSLGSTVRSSETVMDIPSIHSSVTLPSEELELNNQLRAIHLLKAYGEAIDREEQRELAEVIVKRINEKLSSPVGGVMERLLYYLFQPLDKQSEYLKQESLKNFLAAFNAFYQIFPYGKFVHFAANRAILEAIPHGVDIIHIIDFDTGEGIQWPSMIEAIGGQQREIRLTSIKWSDEGVSNCDSSPWRFEETKRRLCDHAKYFGVKLTVDNLELHDLVNEKRRMKKGGGRREWLAFNCMVGLPHMGRVRSKRDALQFLKVAKELVACTTDGNYSNRGIVTFGDGDPWVNSENSSSFVSFLDGHLLHYQALLESMELSFPIHLGAARTAMECLFVSPLISSRAWIRKWKEMDCCDLQSELGLQGSTVSKESLMEAKEMVREGEKLYGLRIEGDNNNVLVLEWSGIPLLRVTCWRS